MFSRIAFAIVLCTAGLAANLARADDAPPPWAKANSVAQQASDAIVHGGGIRAIEPYVADLEDALTKAPDAVAQAASGTGGAIIFTDGMADTFLAMMSAASNKKSAQAVPNPYPVIGLFLGSYYNEIGQPKDALRVLNEALAVTSDVGAHRPHLISERGAALESLERWQEALDNFNDGLKIAGLDGPTHALLLRGRGFSLTELGQLDDAEAAFRESLTFEPGNQRAQSELDYIDKLRLGGSKAPAGLTTVVPAKDQPADGATRPPPAPSGP